MRSDPPAVAVIGGGFSGATLAIQLRRRGLAPFVIEPGPRVGEGAAYRTREPAHLLNIRAMNMSAWPDRPRHFLDWLEAHDGADPQRFEPRATYARYLADLWSGEGQGIPVLDDRATGLDRNGAAFRVHLEHGPVARADAVVLATGNTAATRLPGGLDSALPGECVVADPWSEAGIARVAALAEAGATILALGTGLTLADVVATFAARAGAVIALSRRGLLPQAHSEVGAKPAPPVPVEPFNRLRRRLRASRNVQDWRPDVDGVRPTAPALWQSWSEGERRRFLRHAGPWWSIHRRRTAPATAATLDRMRARGRLEVIAGRLVALDLQDGKVRARWRPRGQEGLAEALVDAVVNCTGFDAGGVADPLTEALAAAGLARPDPLGLGLDVDEAGRVLDGAGRAQPDLFAVGPPTKGAFWEIVAVPEIRVQVAAVADRLAAALLPTQVAAHG